MLITDIINQVSSQLREAGIETSEHDTKLLLAEAAGVELCNIGRALFMREEFGTTGQLAVLRAMFDRHTKREPLQYITGYAPFRYPDLRVGPEMPIPRPETETVVQAGLDWLTKDGMIHPCAVDLCVDSGMIGLSVVSEVPGSQVWATELPPSTAKWTRKNLSETVKKYSSVASNYHLEITDAVSFTTLAQSDGTVDTVITNPPYVLQTDVPEQLEMRDWGPELTLCGGSMGDTLIPERIIKRACHFLKPGGVFVMGHDVTQGDRLVAFAKATGFTAASTGRG